MISGSGVTRAALGLAPPSRTCSCTACRLLLPLLLCSLPDSSRFHTYSLFILRPVLLLSSLLSAATFFTESSALVPLLVEFNYTGQQHSIYTSVFYLASTPDLDPSPTFQHRLQHKHTGPKRFVRPLCPTILDACYRQHSFSPCLRPISPCAFCFVESIN